VHTQLVTGEWKPLEKEKERRKQKKAPKKGEPWPKPFFVRGKRKESSEKVSATYETGGTGQSGLETHLVFSGKNPLPDQIRAGDAGGGPGQTR